MTIDDKIKDEKLQYDINIKAAKISALLLILSLKLINGEEIFPSDQSRIIEQAKFTEQGKKQVEALKVLKTNLQKLSTNDAIPENTFREEAKNELNKIKKI